MCVLNLRPAWSRRLAGGLSRWKIALAAMVGASTFWIAAGDSPAAPAAESASTNGLVVTFNAGGKTDVTRFSQVALHVEPGQSPTPFLPAGPFRATWEGNINAELRGNHLFQAELAGAFELEINGKVVLKAAATNSPSPLSAPVQLNKGANALKATFTSPESGPAFVRLGWTEKGTNASPVPTTVLTHAATDALARSTQLRLGRELFLESRCIRCHREPALDRTGVPELAMDAPALDGIGSRRHYEWMTRWILDPKSVRPTARMPKVNHGPHAREEAEAMAAFLSSLKQGPPSPSPKPVSVTYQTRQTAPASEEGSSPSTEPRPIYERLQCAACHNPPDATELDPAKLSQKGVGTKFPRGALSEFLLAPEAHYAWTRMPNFHLSEAEARELEEYLLNASDKPKDVPVPQDAGLIEKGRKLVQTSGCLNCHSMTLENQAGPLPLAALHDRHSKGRDKTPPRDCLGPNPYANYQFSSQERDALDQFTRAGFESLQRHAPAEFAERQTRLLNCAACHGHIDLVPPLDLLGGKLKPEWSAKFMAGEIPHKIRFDNHPKGEVWVEARMPAFKSRAAALAVGMAAQHGFGPKSPPEPALDPERAEIGRKLVGKDGGFSCVSCHAVGSSLALEVFESEGVNLAYSADRLLPGYYHRWFRNPLAIDPQTKMPVYFDEEGRSPLTDILGGDGDAQMDAVWHYLKLRDKMPPPKTGLE